ncbi:hypothetical protein HU200_032479 [Digitaria exilis]|uniref:Uncharacterized protein n=1 Tax=Digitaria exilis TaxID=1010633 RepID=A0A835BN71_9POAL|nr:hypothetical protein HU200_032479 [Digitaria exilis]
MAMMIRLRLVSQHSQ